MFEQHKKIYQHAGKCDDQQNLKDILDAVMVSTPKVVIDNSPNVPMTSTPVNKPSDSKSLCLFTNILGVKPKNSKTSYCGCKIKTQSHESGY